MKKLFILVVFISASVTLQADEITFYRMRKDQIVTMYSGRRAATAYEYTFSSGIGEGLEERITTTDFSLAAQSFTYRDLKAGTDYTALRSGNKITVTGKLKSKALKREFQINNSPWFQAIEGSLEYFLASSQNNIKFWMISADECEIHEMEATREGTETVLVMGNQVQAYKVKINLTGIAALFWRADYWFRTNDGRYVRYETVEGPGGPKLTVDLVSETTVNQ